MNIKIADHHLAFAPRIVPDVNKSTSTGTRNQKKVPVSSTLPAEIMRIATIVGRTPPSKIF
jgi:hypothetical protein